MKIKDYGLVFLKGILLGLVSVGIPGVSASTIGIVIGIYFLMVDCIANIFKDFKHNFLFLIVLILGYGVGSISAAFSVTILFEKFPLVTTFIILAFIISSIPDMFMKLKQYFKKPSCLITFAVVLAIILLYNFLIGSGAVEEFPREPSIWYLVKMTIIGVITSATFVIPGVDFAVVFLALGIYYPFLNLISELLLFGADNYLQTFIPNITILGFYLVGYFVGVFLFSKLIKFVSKKYTGQTQLASFAFIVAAPFIVIKSCIIDNASFKVSGGQIVAIIIGCLIAFGVMIAIKIISKKNDKKAEEQLIEIIEKNAEELENQTIENENNPSE